MSDSATGSIQRYAEIQRMARRARVVTRQIAKYRAAIEELEQERKGLIATLNVAYRVSTREVGRMVGISSPRVSQIVNQSHAPLLRETRLTPNQTRVLAAVAELGPAGASQVARHLKIPGRGAAGAIGLVFDQLARREMVEAAESSQDGRRVLVTALGAQVLEAGECADQDQTTAGSNDA